MKTILSAATWAILTLWTAHSGAQSQAADRKVELAIEQQSLADALNEWAKQTGLQLVSEGSEMMNATLAPEIKGSYSAEGALKELLGGTRLTYEWVSDRAVAIRAKPLVVTTAVHTTGALEGVPIAPPPQLADTTVPDDQRADGQVAGPLREANASNGSRTSAATVEDLEEVIVTGTHIRGADPIGSRLIVVDRAAIEKSGYATVQAVLKTLPENFTGGVRSDAISNVGGDPAAATNSSYDYAPNLRGLGAGSTLTLLNGRRLAPGGTSGQFAGISGIPLQAVERIEVLPDGASAMYGSDAVGGVINIITRKNYDGAESSFSFGSVTSGEHTDLHAAQLFGASWSQGSALLMTAFQDRDPLLASERSRASSDLRRFGGDNFDSTQCNPGTIIDELGTTYAIPAGQNGSGLTPDSFSPGTENRCNTRAGDDLIGAQRQWNVLGSAQHGLSDRVTIFFDGLFSDRKTTNRFGQNTVSLVVPDTNPFFVDPSNSASGFVTLNYNLARDLGASSSATETKNSNLALGSSIELTSDWTMKLHVGSARETQQQEQVTGVDQALLDQALGDSDPATAFNPFGDGSNTNPATLASLRGSRTSFFGTDSQMLVASAVADGPIAEFHGRKVKMAVGYDYRKQSFDSSLVLRDRSNPDPALDIHSDYERHVSAAFSEVTIPIFTDARDRSPHSHRLDVSLAARHEDYSDFGGETVPRAGFMWAPAKSLKIRGTWGKSFRAPTLADLDTTGNFTYIIALPDVGGGESNTLLAGGNNADLSPETASIWSLGFQYEPPALPSLKISPSYFEIDYKDRITGLPSTNFLTDPANAPAVLRNPTADQQASLCATGAFLGNFGTTPGDCQTAEIDAVVDSRLRNFATVQERGLDIATSYTLDQPNGGIEFGLSGTYLFDFRQKITPSAETSQLEDTAGNPIALRLRGSIAWTRNAVTASAFVNYAKRYQDTISVPPRSIKAWTTVDASLLYEPSEQGGLLSGTQFALSAENVFDEPPPFYNNPLGVAFDQQNANVLGRFITFTIRKSWQ